MKRTTILTIILIAIATSVLASTYGKIFETLLTSQRAGGVTLAGGKVWFYYPGTTNSATVYTDYNKTTPATQPVTLDANGTAQVYGDAVYDVKWTNAEGTEVYYRYRIPLSLNVDYATAAGTATTATTANSTTNATKFGGYSTNEFAVNVPVAMARNTTKFAGYSQAWYLGRLAGWSAAFQISCRT